MKCLNRNNKKQVILTSVRLCTALLLSGAIAALSIVPAIAQPEDGCCGQTPVIMLQGYSGPFLFLDADTEQEQAVWPPPLNGDTSRSMLEILFSALPKLIINANGNSDRVVEDFGEMMKIIKTMEMNDDGTSLYDVSPKPQDAYHARWDRMLKTNQERQNSQRPITITLAEHIPSDHIYVFACDWRQSQLQNIGRLHAFIQEVKALSGHDKVSLFAVSYGGQLATTYFTYYGGADIDRAVMHSPAVRGSRLVVDLLEEKDFVFDLISALDLLTVFLQRELPIAQRVHDVSMEQLNDIAVRILRAHVTPLFLKFGSFWDLVPQDQYERLKKKYLDPVKNADIITRADKMHYDMMPKAGKTLRRMQQEGVKIAIISGYEVPLVSGNQINADFIIDVESITGAKTLPLNSAKRFSKPCAEVCKNTAHQHISPNRRIDASSAYLPEHTWFFSKQYHAMGAWDSYTSGLYCKFLFTDEIDDIRTNPEYPQFRDSSNPSDALEARFSDSVSGYLTADDDTLLLKNLSKYSIRLVSLKAEGLAFEVPMVNRISIKSGETARLRYETTLPNSRKNFTITAEYLRGSAVQSKETRTFEFVALPSHEKKPADLLFPTSEPADAPPASRLFRPARVLTNAVTAALSLVFMALAVAVMMKKKLREQPTPAPKKKKPRVTQKPMLNMT